MQPEIPLAIPNITEEEIAVVSDVLRSGWLAHGSWNHKFEEAFAKYVGVSHAISMNSCTSALEIALKVYGIKSEVIIPSLTWCATANSVVNTGGTPIFCDVDKSTRNMTAKDIEARLSKNTKAVIVVHFAGQPCQMDDILDLCRKYSLILIEDSAETLGATWNGRQAGSMGHVGCFSFFPTKNMTTAEGGMLTCNDAEIARKARALIAHGVTTTTFSREQVRHPWNRAAEFAGHNFRMPNPLAALGYHQLSRLNEMNQKRFKLAERYSERLSSLQPFLSIPETSKGATHVYQMYTIRVPDKRRNELVIGLREDGIGASVHFDPPVHLQPYYTSLGWEKGMLENTECLANELITLPIYPTMTFEDQDRVIESLSSRLRS